MTARERRQVRLLLVVVSIAGCVGTWLAIALGWEDVEGTLWLPVSAVAGLLGLWLIRPQARKRAPGNPRP